MSIVDSVIAEMQHEAQGTRKILERVPEEDFAGKPHEKSMTMGQLASHLADIPTWCPPIVNQDELAFNVEDYVPYLAANTAELLEHFDRTLAEAIQALHGRSDAQMMALWRMKVNGQLAFELPRIAVVRSMILNHAVHHRGQMTVYLRLHDVPLPALYGPSADEQAM